MPTQLAKQMPQKLMRLENMGFYTKLHDWLDLLTRPLVFEKIKSVLTTQLISYLQKGYGCAPKQNWSYEIT